MPEYINYDEPPPHPWWREPLIDAAINLAILAVLAGALIVLAVRKGVL